MSSFIAPLPVCVRPDTPSPFLPSSSSSSPFPTTTTVCTATVPPSSPSSPSSSSASSSSPLSSFSFSSPLAQLRRLHAALSTLERITRPGAQSDQVRYDALPKDVQTPSQMLGRMSPGCEGTNGVFPRCNFSCQPCYHSAEANKVRVDGLHTVTEVARQMSTLQRLRGPTGHCQLIGGEVSLLPPEDHALTLETMRFFGRIPMSFTHGDFDYDYLRRLALVPVDANTNGNDNINNEIEYDYDYDRRRFRPRFKRLDFAVHFDIGMRGRRGTTMTTITTDDEDNNKVTTKLTSEKQLTPFRQRFVDMFVRLRREHGVHFYLAHNMTVQPDNLDSVKDAVRDLVAMGFRLISFQPAALQGARRVTTVRDAVSEDDNGEVVWTQLEQGLGLRLPYSLFQMGDVRCNRMSVLGVLGSDIGTGFNITTTSVSKHRRNNKAENNDDLHMFPLFDDKCPADVRARDIIMNRIGNIVLMPDVLAFKFLRVFLRRPWLIIPAVLWCLRIIARAKGIWNIIRHGGIRPVTVVMHRFMDAEDVRTAWDLMEQGVVPTDDRVTKAGPRIQETIERLQACSYGMAHPDTQQVVPACVQHSVFDPDLNVKLASTLPLKEKANAAEQADMQALWRRQQHQQQQHQQQQQQWQQQQQ